MQGNGDIGSFEHYLGRRLTQMEQDGVSKDSINSMRERGLAITAALVTFRAMRQTLAASGRYSPSGLTEAVGEAAAKAAGEIKRHADDSILREDIRRTKGKLENATKADPTAELINFWRKMELRSTFERQGISIINQATGEISFDSVKANILYQSALARNDALAMEALEEWPTGSPVDAELIAKGQAQHLGDQDPINSQKLHELEEFAAALESTLKDALTELRPSLPVADPIARMAGSAPPDEAA